MTETCSTHKLPTGGPTMNAMVYRIPDVGESCQLFWALEWLQGAESGTMYFKCLDDAMRCRQAMMKERA